MSLLVVIAALVLYKKFTFSWVEPEHRSLRQTYQNRLARLQAQGQPAMLMFVLTVLFPTALVWLFDYYSKGLLWNVPKYAFQLFILLYCFGADSLKRYLDDYLEPWQRGDFQAAYHRAARFVQPQNLERCNDLARLHNLVGYSYLYSYFERLFVVLFWFALLGPAAALFVRMNAVVSEQAAAISVQRFAATLRYWLEWLPARLLVLIFAFGGNAVGGFREGRYDFASGQRDHGKLLLHFAEGAVDGYCIQQPPPGETMAQAGAKRLGLLRDLLSRSLLLWCVGLALLVLLGWVI